MSRVSRKVSASHGPVVHLDEARMDLDCITHCARAIPLFCSPNTAQCHKIVESLATEKKDMKQRVNWEPYVSTVDRGKIAIECQHHSLYLYPNNPKPPRLCFDELRALLQCFAHVHYDIDIEEDVFDLFLSQRLTSFSHFFFELENIIGSRLAISNARRIPALEKELAVERARCRNAEAMAAKAAKQAGQVAAAVLMIDSEEVAGEEKEVARDLTTYAQIALLHEFADYSH